MTISEPLGRRDRKRAETQARIEAAATHLVLRDGLEETTIDAISERADISPRTFFNYFETKDAAILGLPPREESDEALLAHLTEEPADEDVVPAVVRLVFAVMGDPGVAGTTIYRDRLEIIRRHPEVMTSQFVQLTARKNRMAETVATMLAARADFAGDPDLALRADIVFALCASASRAAIQDWAQTADPHTIDHLEQRTVALVTSTLRRL